jgi:uncharacterized protein (DUF1684 family)
MKAPPLHLLESWLTRLEPEFDAIGMSVSITWGPPNRLPAAAWIDFESGKITSRLTIWSGGNAELVIGDMERKEVLLEEHRELMTEVGLDDAFESIKSWLT